MKNISGLWQITLPICAVAMFAMGSYTTVYMVNGRYRVEVSVNNRGLSVKTDIDKNEQCQPLDNSHISQSKDSKSKN